MQIETIFQIIIIIYSIILHEIAHGYATYFYGDKTAFFQNRLTLNPIPHIDPIGSILVPIMLFVSGSPIFAGWAKPVPVNDNNLHPRKTGLFVVAIAGVFVNLCLSVCFAILGYLVEDNTLKTLFAIVSLVNAGLGIFNLIPFPPADGYRILSIVLPYQLNRQIENLLQKYFIFVILFSIFLAIQIFQVIFPIIQKTIFNFIF